MSPPPATPDPAVARLAAVALARAADGRAPEWIQLLPAGERLQGRDGRAWLNDVAGVAAGFAADGGPLAIDFEHAQDLLAVAGQEAPASAWIEAVEPRDGALWGRVDWTPRGRAAVEAREYRFFSPAFTFDPATTRVERLIGGGLVNRPNFVMAALNRTTQDTPSMKQIATALGLPDTATEGECVMALAAHRADHATALARASTPDLARFVPRADLEAALNRAGAAETRLRERDTADRATSATAAVDKAIAQGKVAPSSRDYYLAACRDAAGIAAFELHAANLPSLFAPSGLDGRDAGSEAARAAAAAGSAVALNAEQRAAARAMGLDEAKFAAFLAARTAKGEGA